MRLNGKKRLALVATTAAAVLIGGGVAVAYWTTTGSGTGSAATGTTSTLTVNGTNTPSALYPGGPAQTIDYSIVNGNPGAIYVNQVTIAVTGTNQAGCDATDYAITQPSATAAEVASGTTNYSGGSTGAAIAMIDKPATNQNACKNATVNLSFSSN